MKKKPANYLLIICEDVRSEVDDKFSLIGVTAHPLKLKKTQGKSYATHSIAVYGELPNVKAPEQLEIRLPRGSRQFQRNPPTQS